MKWFFNREAQPKEEPLIEYPDDSIEECVYPVRFELDGMTQEEIDACIRANNGIGRFRMTVRRAHKMF